MGAYHYYVLCGVEVRIFVIVRYFGKIFAGYVAAAGLYIGIGLAEVDFLLSFWTAMGYLLVVAWVVPLVVRKLR